VLVAAVIVLGVIGHVGVASADDSSSGSGSTPGVTTTTATRATRASTAGLRAAAIAWAEAYLTGSAKDIRRLEGPECTGATTTTSLPEAVVVAYLRNLRAAMRRQLGRPLDRIRVRGVQLRNATLDRGEAQVLYDLPQSKVGNDNWVEFTVHDRRWKVSNCQAPILGRSTSTAGH
jgi:hypothetical protein